MTWVTEATSNTVSTIRFESRQVKSYEQYVLLRSDGHTDNSLSNTKLQRKHLDQAKERNAPVIDLGDLFDAMQGRNDRRGGKSKIRAEVKKDNYFDALVDYHESFFTPYLSQLALLGRGNHETAIIKHNETDLTERLVRRLRRDGSPVLLGGYRGWVRFMFNASTVRQSVIMYYTHGSGGSAPVTKGTIDTNRKAAYVNADIVCRGHIHQSWCLELCKIGLTSNGNEEVKDQLHLCIPTYKEEFVRQDSGFHHEKGGEPKPLGAWWLRFYWEDSRIKYDWSRAK